MSLLVGTLFLGSFMSAIVGVGMLFAMSALEPGISAEGWERAAVEPVVEPSDGPPVDSRDARLPL